MQVSITIPDELYQQVEAHSARLGRSVSDLTTELYRRWLDEQIPLATLHQRGLGEAMPQTERDVDGWIDDWVLLGATLADAEPGELSAREIIDDDRRRLER